MAFDMLITGGEVVDGSGCARRRVDVGISNGRIAAIGSLEGTEAAETIDASGQVVAPGFIDMHSHSDVNLLDDPGGESKAFQGVTTEVTGNCSFSPFPAGKLGEGGLREAMGTILRSQAPWSWSSLDGWADATESVGVSLNLAPLVGHGAIRVAAGVNENRPPTPDELVEMLRLAAESVEQGAFGMSTGLTLAPSMYAETDEIASLAKAISPFKHAFYATHARVWAGWHVRALEEAAEIGCKGGVPVQFSHIAIGDSRIFGRGEEMVAVIDRARAEGMDMTCDMYPYTAGASGLNQSLPSWIQEGGIDAMLVRLRDPSDRKRAFEDMAEGHFGGLPWTWDKMFITYVGSDANRSVVGRSLEAIAEDRGVDPREAMLALIDEESNNVGVVGHNRIESDVRFFMQYEHAMIGSDGRAISPNGWWATDKPHPRFYGCYPRILGRYVRDDGVLPLEIAIYKMTGFPAKRLGLKDRGLIREDFAADVLVFDPDTIIDHADFDEPHQLSTGVSHVYVNGQAIISDGTHTGARPGRVLRRGA
ncbi:MAG: D-aminoacylase [SAR202 cluster bacterium]|jgi:N-acyl-D-aspartate/D-glutamate deacylase|nr:D-aminoacylase [SAR202 cluster bacterium]